MSERSGVKRTTGFYQRIRAAPALCNNVGHPADVLTNPRKNRRGKNAASKKKAAQSKLSGFAGW
jgi:hypothetical protein